MFAAHAQDSTTTPFHSLLTVRAFTEDTAALTRLAQRCTAGHAMTSDEAKEAKALCVRLAANCAGANLLDLIRAEEAVFSIKRAASHRGNQRAGTYYDCEIVLTKQLHAMLAGRGVADVAADTNRARPTREQWLAALGADVLVSKEHLKKFGASTHWAAPLSAWNLALKARATDPVRALLYCKSAVVRAKANTPVTRDVKSELWQAENRHVEALASSLRTSLELKLEAKYGPEEFAKQQDITFRRETALRGFIAEGAIELAQAELAELAL